MKTHSGEKSNKCNQCDYASSQASNLRRHLKTHSEEKPNKCNECELAFSQEGHLRTHLNTHSREKSNKCNQCNFASSQASNLRTHLKTHRNRKKTNQSINPLGFSNRRRLDRATGTFVLHQSNVTLCPSQYRTVSSIPIGSPFSMSASSNCQLELMQSRTGRTCLIFLHCAFFKCLIKLLAWIDTKLH